MAGRYLVDTNIVIAYFAGEGPLLARFETAAEISASVVTLGELKNELRRKGRPIPENDIWIAATALQHGLTLVTRDSDFEHVEGIDRESW